jgi:hypothetical protein
MAAFAFLHKVRARWQIRRAIRRLADSDPAVRDAARAALRAAGAACWPQLRNEAFRPRTRLAVLSADLLDQLGDVQGLYALLSQYADPSMHGWYDSEIRLALQRIGVERIVIALEHAVEYLEAPGLKRKHWSLAVSVYTLFALQSLRGNMPAALWLRALTVVQPHFEDLSMCRSAVPTNSYADLIGTSVRPPADDWRVGSTLVAVRRSAVEALITVAPDEAFDLLATALHHKDPRVQVTAIYGLRRLRNPHALVLLQPIAADRRHPLARDARRTIEAFGTRQPDSLTLVRASDALAATPHELLRAADIGQETAPETLLRAADNGE